MTFALNLLSTSTKYMLEIIVSRPAADDFKRPSFSIFGELDGHLKSSAIGLLTNSPAYITFHVTTKNCTLQIQHKSHVLFVYKVLEHILESVRPRVPKSHITASHVPASPSPSVPASLSSTSSRSKSQVPYPSPSPQVPIPLLVTAMYGNNHFTIIRQRHTLGATGFSCAVSGVSHVSSGSVELLFIIFS